MTDRSAPRPDELRVEPPSTFDAGLYFIGRISTPWKTLAECPKNSDEAKAECTVALDARYAPAPRDLVVQQPKHYGVPHGTFALRSPARPNPLALSVVELLAVEGATLRVRGIDCLDGTPLLDIKPYFASTDARPAARVGWHEKR